MAESYATPPKPIQVLITIPKPSVAPGEPVAATVTIRFQKQVQSANIQVHSEGSIQAAHSNERYEVPLAAWQ